MPLFHRLPDGLRKFRAEALEAEQAGGGADELVGGDRAEVRVGERRIALPARAFRFTRAASPAKAVRRGDLVLLERLVDEGKPAQQGQKAA